MLPFLQKTRCITTNITCLSIVCSLLYSVTFSALLNAEQMTTVVQEDREPEAATGFTVKKAVTGQKYMLASANPYATKAGLAVLEKGGSAVDAAIATQLVLTLVEPQSSGLGGGSFMLHWHKKDKKLTSFDGRETAPQAANSDLFLDENGQPLKWVDAVVGGKSVGVPGLLASFQKAHQKFGKLPWGELFTPAITLAEQGFVVSARLEKLLGASFNPGIHKLPEINQYFFPQGKKVQAGDILKNPKLAKSLRSIAEDGVDVFYRGWLAKSIVEKVQNSVISPGLLSLTDMANYQAVERPAVCGTYHQYKLCGMAPPSSGGITVLQILMQLESFNMEQYSANSLPAIHLLSQSSRLAFADRGKYIADSDFVSVPVEGLLDKQYIANRASLINDKSDMGKATAGVPVLSDLQARLQANDDAIERPSTSHLVIIDAEGNAISMTSSIENGFGSALMVEGFILNNQLTDFSLSPKRNGQLVANRVEPGKRPRSSMAPMMVFNNDNTLKLLVGSPGGSRIINYVAQTLIAVLDWKLNVQEAINLPKMTNRNYVTTLEEGTDIANLKAALEKKGHKVKVQALNSGLQAIEVTEAGFVGGADPRREGLVLAK